MTAPRLTVKRLKVRMRCVGCKRQRVIVLSKAPDPGYHPLCDQCSSPLATVSVEVQS